MAGVHVPFMYEMRKLYVTGGGNLSKENVTVVHYLARVGAASYAPSVGAVHNLRPTRLSQTVTRRASDSARPFSEEQSIQAVPQMIQKLYPLKS